MGNGGGVASCLWVALPPAPGTPSRRFTYTKSASQCIPGVRTFSISAPGGTPRRCTYTKSASQCVPGVRTLRPKVVLPQ